MADENEDTNEDSLEDVDFSDVVDNEHLNADQQTNDDDVTDDKDKKDDDVTDDKDKKDDDSTEDVDILGQFVKKDDDATDDKDKKDDDVTDDKDKKDEDPDKDLDEKAPKSKEGQEGWKDLKGRLKDVRTENQKLQDELKTLREQGGDPEVLETSKARIAELEKLNQDMEERLSKVDLKNSPTFQKKFVEPQTKAVETMQKALERSEIDTKVDDILNAGTPKQVRAKLSEVLSDLDDISRSEVTEAFRTYERLEEEAQSAIKNSNEFLTSERQNQSAQRRQVFDSATQEFQKEGLRLQEIQGDDAFNAKLKALPTAAEKLALGSVDPKDAAKSAHKAAHYDFIVSEVLPRVNKAAAAEVSKWQTKATELEKKLKAIEGSAPNPDNRGGGQDTPTPTDGYGGIDFNDVV